MDLQRSLFELASRCSPEGAGAAFAALTGEADAAGGPEGAAVSLGERALTRSDARALTLAAGLVSGRGPRAIAEALGLSGLWTASARVGDNAPGPAAMVAAARAQVRAVRASDVRWRSRSPWAVDTADVRVRERAGEPADVSAGPARISVYDLSPAAARAPVRASIRIGALIELPSGLVVATSPPEASDADTPDALDAAAAALWPQIPDRSLVVLAGGLLAARRVVALGPRERRRAWLGRGDGLRWRVARELGRGDALVELRLPRAARPADPSHGAFVTARAIEYRRAGYPDCVLLTSLIDPVEHARHALTAAYHEFWQDGREPARDTEAVRASQPHPVLVGATAQAAWPQLEALIALHNLARALVARSLADVPPGSALGPAETAEIACALWRRVADGDAGEAVRALSEAEAAIRAAAEDSRRAGLSVRADPM